MGDNILIKKLTTSLGEADTKSFTLISLPYDKILDMSRLKAFADDHSKVNLKTKFALGGGAENIVGKGNNAGYQHFLLFPQCFQKASFLGSVKVGIVW